MSEAALLLLLCGPKADRIRTHSVPPSVSRYKAVDSAAANLQRKWLKME